MIKALERKQKEETRRVIREFEKKQKQVLE